jgi:hypothetical protein
VAETVKVDVAVVATAGEEPRPNARNPKTVAERVDKAVFENFM